MSAQKVQTGGKEVLNEEKPAAVRETGAIPVEINVGELGVAPEHNKPEFCCFKHTNSHCVRRERKGRERKELNINSVNLGKGFREQHKDLKHTVTSWCLSKHIYPVHCNGIQSET